MISQQAMAWRGTGGRAGLELGAAGWLLWDVGPGSQRSQAIVLPMEAGPPWPRFMLFLSLVGTTGPIGWVLKDVGWWGGAVASKALLVGEEGLD